MRTGTIRCGYVIWPPFFEKDINTGEIKGLDKDLSETVAKLLSLKIEFVEVQLGFQVQDMKQGKIDAVCGDGPFIISGYKSSEYTAPFGFVPVYPYVRTDEKRFSKPADLNKKEITFAAIDGDLSQNLKDFAYPQASLHALPNITDPAQALMDVATGKADVFINDPLTVGKFSKSYPGKVKPIFTDTPAAIYPFGFSVAKGEHDLLTTLSGGVEMAHNLNLLRPIFEKYDPGLKNFMLPAKPYRDNKP